MPTNYTVKQGDCVASVAATSGFSLKKIWDAPENADLKALRTSPYLLLPGDPLVIPDLKPKDDPCPTDGKHPFKKAGTPVWLKLRFLDDGKPRENEPYVLTVGALEFKGATGAGGKLEHQIPADAAQGVLRLGPPDSPESYIIKLGALDPLAELSGVQGRLVNLGFNCGDIDGILGPRTQRALRQFQEKYNLDMTGQADDATRGELEKQYGC